MPTRVSILEELDENGAWLFRVQIGTQHKTLRLAWQDYEDWSSGTLPPATIARAVIEALLHHHAADTLPDNFDAARYRRAIASFDDDLKHALSNLGSQNPTDST